MTTEVDFALDWKQESEARDTDVLLFTNRRDGLIAKVGCDGFALFVVCCQLPDQDGEERMQTIWGVAKTEAQFRAAVARYIIGPVQKPSASERTAFMAAELQQDAFENEVKKQLINDTPKRSDDNE